MLNYFKLNKTPLLGLDLHPKGFKWVQLRKNKAGIELLAYAVASFADEVEMCEQLSRTLKVFNIKSNYVAISLLPNSFFCRQISIPKHFSDADIQEQIELEADYYIPYPFEKMVYDFEKLQPSTIDPHFFDVRLVAAEIKAIQNITSLLEQIGLQTSIVEVTPSTMERAYSLCQHQLLPHVVNENIGLIDFSPTFTIFYVFKMRRTIYYGVQEGGSLIENIIQAIQNFFSTSEEKIISHLFLAGTLPEEMDSSLISEVAEKTGIPTSVVDPIHRFRFSEHCDARILKQNAPTLMRAFGLALRGV